LWLEAGLGIDRSRALSLESPATGLGCTPEHQTECSTARLERVERVAAKRVDANVIRVSTTHSQRTAVRFENVPPVVVLDDEQAGVGRVASLAPITGVSRIPERDFVPTPSIHLEHAASRHPSDKSDVVGL